MADQQFCLQPFPTEELTTRIVPVYRTHHQPRGDGSDYDESQRTQPPQIGRDGRLPGYIGRNFFFIMTFMVSVMMIMLGLKTGAVIVPLDGFLIAEIAFAIMSWTLGWNFRQWRSETRAGGE